MDEDSAEDLEQRVAELEATVRGLTEELVDVTERVRQLEDGEPSPGTRPVGEPADTAATPPAEDAGAPDEGEAEAAAGADGDPAAADEAARSEDTGSEEGEDSDDIIVA